MKKRVFKHQEFPMYQQLYNTVVNAIQNGIYESLHIVTNFDECINDIVNTWIGSKGKMLGTYNTNWVYNIKNETCYKLNDNAKLTDDDFEIYIEYISDIDEVPAYNKIRGIDLQISEHKIVIGYNNRTGGGLKYIKARLKHEFTHIREQYAKKDVNVILNKKNTASNITNIFNIDTNDFYKITDILYFITPTEQHARINEFQEFLKTVKFDEIKDILEDVDFTKYSLAQIYRTICFYYDNITLLQSYVSTLEELHKDNSLMMYLGYYITSMKLYNLKITENNVHDLNESLIDNVYDYLKNVYIAYIKKLVSVMDKVFSNNGITELLFEHIFS